LGYFADRYGFTIVGSALGRSTETASPSAQELARLIESLRADPVPALFGEFGEPNLILKQIAEEAGIPRVIPLYADSLGPAGSEGDTYVGMMRYNAEALGAALAP
ncbi:MAG: metal ABC transporter solute-binding protein, Zn/Mn family, partial [Anaerolineales bacterium]